MILIRYLLLFTVFCCWAQSTQAAVNIEADGTGAAAFPDENIHINADRMNQNLADEIYTADGNVVVLWKGMKLVADQVRYSAAINMMYATGSVVLSKASTVLKGDTLTLNTDSGLAEMDKGLLTVPESSMTVTAEKIVRVSEELFTSTATELTTCDIRDPSWKFGASALKVNPQEYVTGRNVIFYIKNVPVLYLPWFAFPIVPEKKSGLLFPNFGYSKKRGAQLDIPAYWAIDPSQDLQLDLDLLSKRGIGTGLSYRYIRNRKSEGHVRAYQIYDHLADKWRWEIAQEHKEIFSNSTNLRMTVNANSDRTFLSDFGDKSGTYNRQSNETIVNTLNTWQDYAVTSHLRYTENLYADSNDATLQTLPSLGVAAVRQTIFQLPLYFDLDSSADNLYRESGPSGQRVHFFPRITLLPFQNSYLQATLFAGAHIRGYTTDERDHSGEVKASDGNLLPEAGVRLSTSLTRVYDASFPLLKKIRHEIIPEINYGFVPEHNQQRLPFYDYTDRIIHRNMVSLSATSLINGKFILGDTTEYHDVSRVKISADYAVDGGRRDLLTLVDSRRPWSDLMLESDTWLTRSMRIRFDTRYNLYEHHLSTAVAGIEVGDRQGNTIEAGYQMARNEVEYFEGRISTKMINPLLLSYAARYSFDRGDFLESVYSVEYRHNCWSVNLAVHQRPGNQSYTVNFNLAGLGSK